MRWSANRATPQEDGIHAHEYLRRGSLNMRYLLWQGPSSPKLRPAPMAAPVGRSQQALGLLFRRATPDAFHLPALFPSNPFLENTDPQLSCHGLRWGWKQSDQAAPGDRSTVGSSLVACLANF